MDVEESVKARVSNRRIRITYSLENNSISQKHQLLSESLPQHHYHTAPWRFESWVILYEVLLSAGFFLINFKILF